MLLEILIKNIYKFDIYWLNLNEILGFKVSKDAIFPSKKNKEFICLKLDRELSINLYQTKIGSKRLLSNYYLE